MKRPMITENTVVKIQNLIVNYESRPVKLNPVNTLSANPTKWSNTIKQFVFNLLTNCLSMFDHFLVLAPKGLTIKYLILTEVFKYLLFNYNVF